MELAEQIKTNRKYLPYVSQIGAEHCELYVDTMSQYEPDALVDLFKTTLSDYAYRVDECLRVCRERRAWDACAYLLEQSGQAEKAFELHTTKLEEQLAALVQRQIGIEEKDPVKLLTYC